MEIENKVFSSNIIRSQNNTKNNLHDILNIIPALPIALKPAKASECNYVPKNDKYYIPKKKTGMKVKTVRDIRNLFELDVYSYLPADLEKQKNLLLRKIRHGSSRDEKTKETAKDMLKSCTPISRSAWQMLMNINPEGQKFPRQFVIWNGKYIQVNGSQGGSHKFMYKYDIGKFKGKTSTTSTVRKNNFQKRKGLLQNSLNVRFKPGPLTKKKNLDTSYQKHQFGEMELVSLPKPGLDIQPSYGKPLAPVINTFLQNAFVLNSNGFISQKWADFAVSVLGSNENGIPVQLKEDCKVTFDLDYKCFQKRILMRKDSEIINHERVNYLSIQTKEDDSVIISEVKNILDKVIGSVEISLQQNMLCREDEAREITPSDFKVNSNNLKDKGKRKYCELDRLDVTVIRISDMSESDTKNSCRNAYCILGCICDSLKYTYGLKTHCGRIECMFQCKCDFSKYKLTDSFDNNCSEIIPGLVTLDKKLEQTLAKEEQKFHQTVIVTDEKSILLKSRKRNWKASKKYADFYSTMHLKAKCSSNKILTIACENLKFINVEPWCMVHNLYKCFCKGKFTEGRSLTVDDPNLCTKISERVKKTDENMDLTSDKITANSDMNAKEELKDDDKLTRKYDSLSDHVSSIELSDEKSCKCARTFAYKRRKYNDDYYQSANKRILELEQNDKNLRKKLLNVINKNNSKESNLLVNNNTCNDADSSDLKYLFDNEIEETVINTLNCNKDVKKLTSKKLVEWLESNYKQYKEQANQNLIKHSLQPPKQGTMALYPWDFILSRYRERKNHFLISKQQPFRIFMAVNIRHSLFENCININDIALSDLDKYPVTVKNLLTNATDLKDNFCILCGLSHCWELAGSVTKVNSNRETITEINDMTTINNQSEKSQSEYSSDLEFSPVYTEKFSNDLNNAVTKVTENNSEQSKWFVMTVENDFTEIRFYKKGFFVKYDSIMKAINVAKLSGKTVKLSSQNCSYLQNSPNFGIYAIPSGTDNYVFIGPYEKDEPLGVETIKTLYDIKKSNKTRGTWITTNKVDNLKVIDNPLLFMPTSNTNKNLLTVESDSTFKEENTSVSVSKQAIEVTERVVKPIKILKTNGFYQLAPNGLLKQVNLRDKGNLNHPPSFVIKKSVLVNKNATRRKVPILNPSASLGQDIFKQARQTEMKTTLQCQKPFAEIATLLKERCNTSLSCDAPRKKFEGGMFVLKPEEINKRSFENEQLCEQQRNQRGQSFECSHKMDIVNFLDSNVASVSSKHECYVISDDEDANEGNQSINCDSSKDVWIVCKNVDNLGWIPGKRNNANDLSFEFPGFKYSEFYNESEAFNKITQVLSRKIYIPRHINLDWEALEILPDSYVKNKLEEKDLCVDYVLTKKGLQHKSELLRKLKLFNSVGCSTDDQVENENIINDDLSEEKNSIINVLEETSKTLEEERLFLWDKTVSKKNEIISSLSKASEDIRKQLSNRLNIIKYDVDDSD